MTGLPDVDSVNPPWGSYLAEEFLLQEWDFESTESPDQQRKRLVKAFIGAGPRRPGSNEKHDNLIKYVDMYNAVDGQHRLLNDADLYNFGTEWQQVFDFMPELLEPQEESDWTLKAQRHTEAVEKLKDFAIGGIDRAPAGLRQNFTRLQASEMEHYIAWALQSAVHETCVMTWIVLEDEEALETGMVAILFLDAVGRVVRKQRVDADEAESMGGFWMDGSWNEFGWWDDAELGEDYKDGGTCERLLLKTRGDS
ncbi:MAG: hypothetical protein Q9199_002013 [Rusavskia elegans]